MKKISYLLILVPMLTFGQVFIYDKNEKLLKAVEKENQVKKVLDSLRYNGKTPFYIQRKKNGKYKRCKLKSNRYETYFTFRRKNTKRSRPNRKRLVRCK